MKRRAKKKKWKLVREKPLLRIWKWYRRKYICEYLCDDCSKPYVEKPKGMRVELLISGSSAAQVFVEERLGHKNYYVEFGRTTANGHRLVLSPLFTRDQLDDAAKVAALARTFIDCECARRAPRRQHQRR